MILKSVRAGAVAAGKRGNPCRGREFGPESDSVGWRGRKKAGLLPRQRLAGAAEKSEILCRGRTTTRTRPRPTGSHAARRRRLELWELVDIKQDGEDLDTSRNTTTNRSMSTRGQPGDRWRGSYQLARGRFNQGNWPSYDARTQRLQIETRTTQKIKGN